jgi:hypothetical protein
MRRMCICLLYVSAFVIFLALFASGQDFPKAEVFGGYSYLHIDTQGITTASLNNQCTIVFSGTCPVTFQIHPGFNGWNIAPQVNLNRWFGVKAQIAGQYGNVLTGKYNTGSSFFVPGQHIYDFLFGPVVSHRGEKYTVFAHGLLGGQHVGIAPIYSTSGFGTLTPPSETDFAVALGGGLDLKVAKHFAIRAGQFDYEFVNSSGGGHQNDFRFSAGVVFGFGGQK